MARRHARRKTSAGARPEQIARNLGWFSIGLGLAQIVAPRAVCRVTGLPVAPTFMRLCGLRELACGIGLLTQEHPVPWLQARVAGDALDLAALAGAAMATTGSSRRVAVSMAAVAGITALDAYCSRTVAAADAKVPKHVRASISIDRPAEDLYRYWRDFQNFPRLMPHIESVQPLGDNVFHWVTKGPGGTRLEWDSEVIDDHPNERLAWRSVDGSHVFNAGSVRFDASPSGQGTYVTVELLYQTPADGLGPTVARIFRRDAKKEVRADLRAFKTLMEARESAATRRPA